MKIAIICHIFYPELWDELAKCIRRIHDPYDLYITYSAEEKIKQAKKDFPSAKFIKVANKGYDIWPFIKVVNDLDLSKYSYVIKLHTKRNMERCSIHKIFEGSGWRKRLLSFLSTDKAWGESKNILKSKPDVGMIADPFCIFTDKDLPFLRQTFNLAMDMGYRLGMKDVGSGAFVAGTMFIVRSECLEIFRQVFKEDDFPDFVNHEEGDLAHVIERLLGFCVSAKSMVISDPLGLKSEIEKSFLKLNRRLLLRTRLRAFMRNFWQVKITSKKYLLVKCCKIPIYRKRISNDDYSEPCPLSWYQNAVAEMASQYDELLNQHSVVQ